MKNSARLSRFHYFVIIAHPPILSAGPSCIWQHDTSSWPDLLSIGRGTFQSFHDACMEIKSLCAAGCEWNFTTWAQVDQTCAVCVCVSLVFCWIVLSKQVERPVVLRDTAVVWEDMRERESGLSEKESTLWINEYMTPSAFHAQASKQSLQTTLFNMESELSIDLPNTANKKMITFVIFHHGVIIVICFWLGFGVFWSVLVFFVCFGVLVWFGFAFCLMVCQNGLWTHLLFDFTPLLQIPKNKIRSVWFFFSYFSFCFGVLLFHSC